METFRRHPMGRSLAPIAQAPAVGAGLIEGKFSFESGSSRFTLERRDGKEFHRESRFDEQSQALAEVEAEVRYALGSGARGVSYLIERDGRLFQSPISWYSQKKKWDLSPGYEARNHHFERPIEPQCLFCHANRVDPVELSVNRYREPIFSGHAIGCERCHGPGELHVDRQEFLDGPDLTIVNPRHLEPSLRAAVCEQCHLLGDHRIELAGREPFDYRPGLATSAFFAVFDRSNRRGNKAVGHVEQMKASRCYRESRGELGCISCHDPHKSPAPEEKLALYRGKCLDCHARTGCSLPRAERLVRSPDDSCIACHMPMSKDSDIVHIAVTDHRILRAPQSQAPDPSVMESGSPLVLLNGDDPAHSELASVGRELGGALTFEGEGLPSAWQRRGMGSLALTYLERALEERPDDVFTLRMKSRALAIMRRLKDAIDLDDRVLSSAPCYEQALEERVQYAIEIGEKQPALAPAARAVLLNPWSAAAHEHLAYIQIQSGDWGSAIQEARGSLGLNPFRRYARMFLIQCQLHLGDLKGALEEFRILSGLFPTERSSLERWFVEKRRSQRN
jgi:hypothetical protein